MAALLQEEYDVDQATAIKDSQDLAKKWFDAGIIND
jgi:hypothetical protein